MSCKGEVGEEGLGMELGHFVINLLEYVLLLEVKMLFSEGSEPTPWQEARVRSSI